MRTFQIQAAAALTLCIFSAFVGFLVGKSYEQYRSSVPEVVGVFEPSTTEHLLGTASYRWKDDVYHEDFEYVDKVMKARKPLSYDFGFLIESHCIGTTGNNSAVVSGSGNTITWAGDPSDSKVMTLDRRASEAAK
jgi:hypothetical protein